MDPNAQSGNPQGGTGQGGGEQGGQEKDKSMLSGEQGGQGSGEQGGQQGSGEQGGQGSGEQGGEGKDKSMLADAGEQGEQGKEGEGDDKGGVPEKYELNFPEGMEVDETQLGQYHDFARTTGLSNEQAQQAMDYYFDQIDKADQAVREQQAQQRQDWRSQINGDKVLGSPEGRALVVKAMNIDPEFSELVKNSWLGDHPAVHSFLHKVGQLTAEDTPPKGSGGGSGPVDLAAAMFDKTPSR